MPKCVKCGEIFPPNYTEVIDDIPDDSGQYPQHCVFCKLNVTEVERETFPDSGKFVKYTKEQCLNDYHEFLRKLKNNKNPREIINKTKGMGLI